MKIDKIISFLTHPGKNIEQPDVNGTEIPTKGNLYDMLLRIFEDSESNLDLPIMFDSENNEPHNPVREKIVQLASTKSKDAGKYLADRLQCSTPASAGMGLIFFIIGSSNQKKKIVISRFPAQEGILAQVQSKALKIEFMEQVFIKSANSYKSAMYTFKMPNHDLWSGHAVDKQLGHGSKEAAAYWVNDFLYSKFETTSAEGTRQLAKAVKKAIEKTDDVNTKMEIISAVNLANNITKERMSASSFCDRFHLSPEAKEEILSHMMHAKLSDEVFLFDKDEFREHLLYKIIELDNGAILSAQTTIFEKCFQKPEEKESEVDGNTVTYTTSGKILHINLKKKGK